MSEVQLDPYVLHQFSAEPVYVEGSRVDSVFYQDLGPEFVADRYNVDRQSLQMYEATVELTGLHPDAPILCDAAYFADLFEYRSHAGLRVYTEFYLDDRLTDAGADQFPSETPTSGEVPIPPYSNPYDGSTQVRVRYELHPALQPEDPDPQYLNQEFPFTLGPYFTLDSLAHVNHPYYFYIYPPLPATFTVRVIAVLSLPHERRANPPTDVGPFETLPGNFGFQYPVGGETGPGIDVGQYGPPSTEADTTYAHVERVDWPTHRLDVLQFGNLIPPGEVFVGPGPRGVVHSRQVPGRRTVAESIAAQGSDIIVTDVGETSNARLSEPGVVGAGGRGRGVVLRPQTKTPV